MVLSCQVLKEVMGITTALWTAWILTAVPRKDATTATSELAGDGGSLTLTLKVMSAGRDPCAKVGHVHMGALLKYLSFTEDSFSITK